MEYKIVCRDTCIISDSSRVGKDHSPHISWKDQKINDLRLSIISAVESVVVVYVG
jgi:hypothetical protein